MQWKASGTGMVILAFLSPSHLHFFTITKQLQGSIYQADTASGKRGIKEQK